MHFITDNNDSRILKTGGRIRGSDVKPPAESRDGVIGSG